MVKNLGYLSPHNCTECGQFDGNLVFRSDSEPDIKHFEEMIFLDCKKRGKAYQNNNLWVCNYFEYDDLKDPLVVRDTSFNSRMFRVYSRVHSSSRDAGIESKIYDYVCRVCDLDARGYNFSVCVHRIHLDFGISREAVFRCLMGMVEAGYLTREQIEGVAYLKPPSSVRSISEVLEIGKRKVLA